MKLIINVFFYCVISLNFFSQQNFVQFPELKSNEISVVFKENLSQKYGFDEYQFVEWQKYYSKTNFKFYKNYFVPVKSIATNENDIVNAILRSSEKISSDKISFYIKDKILISKKINDSTFSLFLPKKQKNYSVIAYFLDNESKIKIGKLDVRVFSKIKKNIIVVPVTTSHINKKELENQLNKIYSQANIEFNVSLENKFKSKIFDDKLIFSTPSESRDYYTGQMHLLRDLYFETNPKSSKNAYYVFVINQYLDTNTQGFMVKNKSMAFVSINQNSTKFHQNVAKTLAYGIGILNDSWFENGPEKGSTQNLMDCVYSSKLNNFQWNNIRHYSNSYSLYDNNENIKTNNGTVAYYFWNEDKEGNIELISNKSDNFLESIKRPYKKNFLSYRFDVKYKILKPFYKIGSYYISLVNLIFVLLIVIIILIVRKIIKNYWLKKDYKSNFGRRLVYLPFFLGTMFLTYESLKISNFILDKFKQISGPLIELENFELRKAKKEILISGKLIHKETRILSSEILIHKDQKWNLKKRMKVLYFEIKKNKKTNLWNKIKLVSNSDSIKLQSKQYYAKAYTHYMIFNFVNDDGTYHKQLLMNHLGVDITHKINIKDPAKRILVFVNGYRPTSIGHTFEENVQDISKKGLEFPNSKNLIYDFDRYDYWTQWNQINLLFQNRINPSETYYADGHFSVSTSNYGSLLNFTQISSQYPKRCSNKNKHICYKKKKSSIKNVIFNTNKTIQDLKMKPNKNGFKLRMQKGKLAGENLLQVLNEVPNHSLNDTLYIVSHSMGFAYSLGIINELRGKIKFGAFYIIAPENAKTGKINEKEWTETWQFGSKLNKNDFEAPCLQDGVAPQTKVTGLSDNKRIYIPKNQYYKKGFFDSHFIGYYTWIFNINPEKPGHIKQN